MLCLPQPSSFSLAASRLGWPLQDTALISLHGRPLETIMRHLQPAARVLALSWDAETPSKVARLLRERGMGATEITILESLGGPRERCRRTTAARFAMSDIASLNIVALEAAATPGARVLPLAAGLEDSWFEHDGQLTKREVRAVTLAALAPRQGDLLWDVGLGAGSIAIEWLLRHPSLRAFGIEVDEVRAARAMRNAVGLGAPDLVVVAKRAPAAFEGLPAPDAVFLGGGVADAAVFDAAWSALKPGGRLVANAVSLQSEARLSELFRQHGGELVRLDVARAGRAGAGQVFVWRHASPIVQWRVSKP
jgi:precorrin-6Y C5,15-methyltransferase (decarboxylating)